MDLKQRIEMNVEMCRKQYQFMRIDLLGIVETVIYLYWRSWFKYKLDKRQKRMLHDEITGQGYGREEIEAIARD